MADDKVLRISAQIDSASFSGLTSQIKSAVMEVEKLGDALSRISTKGMGGGPVSIGGGGPAPAGFAGAQPAMRGSGLGASLTQDLGQVGPAMQRAASDARTGARALGDSLRDAAAAGEPQIRRLQSAVEALAGAMRQIKEMGSAGGGGQRSLPGMGPPPAQSADQIQTALPGVRAASGRATMMGMGPQVVHVRGEGPAYGEVPSEAYAPGATNVAGPTFMQRLNAMGQREIRAPQVIADMIPAGMRGAVARYGLAAGAAYGGYKAYDWMTSAMGRSNTINAEERMVEQFYGSNLRAAAGDTFGGTGVGILQGNLGLQRASRLAMRSPEFQRLGSLDMTIRREQMNAAKRNDTTFTEAVTGQEMQSTTGFKVGNIRSDIGAKVDQLVTKHSNTWGEAIAKGLGHVFSAGSKVEGALEQGVSKIFGITGAQTGIGGYVDFGEATRGRDRIAAGLLTGRSDEQTENAKDILQRRDNANIPIQRMEEFRRLQAANLAADPMFNYVASQAMGGAQGRMDLMRAVGIGGGVVKDRQGRILGTSEQLYRARGEESGLLSQYVQATQTIQGIAGRGLRGYGPSVAGAMAGGLGGAAAIFSQGALLGGPGGPGAFFRAAQGTLGAGGLDVTAGGGLAETVAGLLRQGHAGIGGGEALEAIAGAAFRPAMAGENQTVMDMRSATAMQGGLQHEAERMGGGIDPLGQALTRRAALRVAGGRGPYVADALERLARNPAEFAQVMRSGHVPPGLAALGVQKEDLDALRKEQNLQNTVRMVQRGLPPGAAGDLAKRLIGAHGDVTGAVTGLLDERLGKGYAARLQQLRKTAPGSARLRSMEQQARGAYEPALAGLSEIQASDTGEKRSAEEIQANLELQLGLGGFGRRARGHGAGDVVGRDTVPRLAAERTAAGVREGSIEETDPTKQGGKLREELKKPVDLQVEAMEAANKHMQAVAGDAAKLDATTQALDVALARVAQGMNRLADKLGVARR